MVCQPIVCECLQSLVEYTKTVMFTWMFIEGFYLHKLVVTSVFPPTPNYVAYYVAGWGECVWLGCVYPVVCWLLIRFIIQPFRMFVSLYAYE